MQDPIREMVQYHIDKSLDYSNYTERNVITLSAGAIGLNLSILKQDTNLSLLMLTASVLFAIAVAFGIFTSLFRSHFHFQFVEELFKAQLEGKELKQKYWQSRCYVASSYISLISFLLAILLMILNFSSFLA